MRRVTRLTGSLKVTSVAVADRGGGEVAGAHVTQQGGVVAIADEAGQAAEVLRQELRFRCSQCGTDRTGFVVTSRDNPQPW